MYINNTVALVSVIIPTYNREFILENAIISALRQSYSNVQIIVVDDGSTDNTRTIVERYPEVEYIYQVHGGQGMARNTGLKHARGYYIASLDSDDKWKPDFLERCVYKLEQDKLDFVFANWTQVTLNNQEFNFLSETKILDSYSQHSADGWIILDNEKLRKIYMEMCPSPSSSLVIKASSILYKWNEHLNIADDWCLLLDMILLNKANAAFTFDSLWLKNTDGKNIFDGRDNFEVLELLYIKDVSCIINRYQKSLTTKEIKLLRDKIAYNTYLLFLFRLTRLKTTNEDYKMLKTALKINSLLFFKVAYRGAHKKIASKGKKLLKKLTIKK